MINPTTISSASIDWSKVPGKFKDDHADVVAMSEFYDQDKDIKEAVDSYLKQLNAELAKAKPAAAPLKVVKKKTVKSTVKEHPEAKYAVGDLVKIKGVVMPRTITKSQYHWVDDPSKKEWMYWFDNKNTNGIWEHEIRMRYAGITPAPEKKPHANKHLKSGLNLKVTKSHKFSIGETVLNADTGEIVGTVERLEVQHAIRDSANGWIIKEKDGHLVLWLERQLTSKPAKEHANKHPDAKAKFSAKGAEGYLKSELTKAKRGDYRELTTAQVVAKARAFQSARTKSGANRDEKGDSKKRLSPTPENLVRWMNNPGSFDIIGIDTYQKNDPTADLKIKTQAWWNRLGIKL